MAYFPERGRQVLRSAERPERGQRVVANAAQPAPKTEPPPAPGSWAAIAREVGGWTSHGYWYGPGRPNADTAPSARTLCGGPGLCSKCSGEAALGDPPIPPGPFVSPVDAWMRRAVLLEVEAVAAELTRKLRLAGALPEDLHVEYETREVREPEPASPSLLVYRMQELEKVLDEVLRSFHERGHPGCAAVRSGWIREETVARWRAVLDRGRPRL